MEPQNIQNAPYLRVQRTFPVDNLQALSVELDKSYVDTANCVNSRTIGIYPSGVPITTGNQWFLSGTNKKQQTLRQVYQVTSTSSVAHGISFAQIQAFTNVYGSFTDGTNYYGLVYGSSTAIAAQVSFYLTPTQIVFLSGAGAPSLSVGIIVLEWLSLF